MMSLTGRLGMGALVLLLILLGFNINKAYRYEIRNIELSQQLGDVSFELRSANAQTEFSYFQLEQSRTMNMELQKEKEKISNKYDGILNKYNDLNDDYISEKLVSILNDVNKE